MAEQSTTGKPKHTPHNLSDTDSSAARIRYELIVTKSRQGTWKEEKKRRKVVPRAIMLDHCSLEILMVVWCRQLFEAARKKELEHFKFGAIRRKKRDTRHHLDEQSRSRTRSKLASEESNTPLMRPLSCEECTTETQGLKLTSWPRKPT